MRAWLNGLISVSLVAAGLILSLSGSPLGGAAVLFAGVGIWMADFRFKHVNGQRRLVAAGTPALLLLPLLLGSAKLSVTSLSLLPFGVAQAAVHQDCPVDHASEARQALRPVWIHVERRKF